MDKMNFTKIDFNIIFKSPNQVKLYKDDFDLSSMSYKHLCEYYISGDNIHLNYRVELYYCIMLIKRLQKVLEIKGKKIKVTYDVDELGFGIIVIEDMLNKLKEI